MLEPFIDEGLQELLQFIGKLFHSSDPSPSVWMHVQCVGQPVSSTERADDFVTTFDIVNITGGNVDSSWTTADTGRLATHLGGLCNAWASRMSSDYTWRELRMYKRSFNGYDVEEPFVKSGPPFIIYPSPAPGTSAMYQAPQVAFTTTERTAYAGHWGRNYWPHPAGDPVIAGGFASTTFVDAWATAVHNAYAALMAEEFYPVVPVTRYTQGKVVVPARGLLTLTEVQVDNLFDVMRSRRPKKATYKKILSV
jgi:hypothetical protein